MINHDFNEPNFITESFSQRQGCGSTLYSPFRLILMQETLGLSDSQQLFPRPEIEVIPSEANTQTGVQSKIDNLSRIRLKLKYLTIVHSF